QPFLGTHGPHGGPLFASVRGPHHTGCSSAAMDMPMCGLTQERGIQEVYRRVEGEASSQAVKWKGKHMADKVRYNKIIDLLERGKPVFSTSTVPNGNLDDLTYIADADYDAVVIEMEHEGFSFSTLRTSLQVLLNRKRIAEKGNLQPDVVPLVRIPPNARERDQWVIKQALDTGVYGLVLPHLSTVEDAQAAVAAARYPQVLGAQDFEPAGGAGLGNRRASPIWGLTPAGRY